MLGIVWNVTKLVDRIFERRVEDCKYLRALVTSRDVRIKELEEMLSQPSAVALVEPARGETPRRVRNWRDQKAILEKKFQPSELREREGKWRREAKDAAASLEVQDAS